MTPEFDPTTPPDEGFARDVCKTSDRSRQCRFAIRARGGWSCEKGTVIGQGLAVAPHRAGKPEGNCAGRAPR